MFKRFWRWFGKECTARVTHAVMDMCKAFASSFRVHCPDIKIIYDKLHDLALARPELSDEGLRAALREEYGVELSRRSITQYRKEPGVGALNRRIAKRWPRLCE